MQMGELSEFLTDENCYFAGTGWPLELKNSTNFLSQVIGSAEPVALIAKEKLETNKIFLPENANPIYLKTPEYKKS